jgi:hypothetical protein
MRRRMLALVAATAIALLPVGASGDDSLYVWLGHQVWFLTGSLVVSTSHAFDGDGPGSEAFTTEEYVSLLWNVTGVSVSESWTRATHVLPYQAGACQIAGESTAVGSASTFWRGVGGLWGGPMRPVAPLDVLGDATTGLWTSASYHGVRRFQGFDGSCQSQVDTVPLTVRYGGEAISDTVVGQPVLRGSHVVTTTFEHERTRSAWAWDLTYVSYECPEAAWHPECIALL